MLAVGVDIGGTKCAVCLGRVDQSEATVLLRCSSRPTAGYAPYEMLDALAGDIHYLMEQLPAGETLGGIGISCGGPLDSRTGMILSPPNLPKWDKIPIVDYLSAKAGVPAHLCNDANAGALAEWRYGAGRGCRNLIFLTFGTGLGAGLILNDQLYEGLDGLAGEVGHIRLAKDGPTGYGKAGSFEGYCSGGGIAQLAREYALREFEAGHTPSFCREPAQASSLNAKLVAAAAKDGDPVALRLFEEVGTRLGEGLAILIDLLNPERIIIGSIFTRCQDLILPAATRVLSKEAIPAAYSACQILPSALAESIGDIAALAVAGYYLATA